MNLNKIEKEIINIIKPFIEEEEEEFKEKDEYLLLDKKKMSEELYSLLLEKYERTPFDERKEKYKEDMCRCCRFNWNCDKSIIPKNILKPVESDRDWIPARIGCEDFKWD